MSVCVYCVCVRVCVGSFVCARLFVSVFGLFMCVSFFVIVCVSASVLVCLCVVVGVCVCVWHASCFQIVSYSDFTRGLRSFRRKHYNGIRCTVLRC